MDVKRSLILCPNTLVINTEEFEKLYPYGTKGKYSHLSVYIPDDIEIDTIQDGRKLVFTDFHNPEKIKIHHPEGLSYPLNLESDESGNAWILSYLEYFQDARLEKIIFEYDKEMNTVVKRPPVIVWEEKLKQHKHFQSSRMFYLKIKNQVYRLSSKDYVGSDILIYNDGQDYVVTNNSCYIDTDKIFGNTPLVYVSLWPAKYDGLLRD